MHNIKRSIEYARQASSVFVKPLTQQSVLAAIRSKWHSKFALHPRSTTIRLRIKQGMAARAGLRIQLRARRRAPDDDGDVVRNDEPGKASERDSPGLGNGCACRISVEDTSSCQFVTCIGGRRDSLHNHLSLRAAIRPSRTSLFLVPDCQQYGPGLSHRPEAMRTFRR